MDFQEFEAAMSENELGTGELLHLEMEKLRRLALLFGISKSSNQLRQIITEHPNGYLDALKICVTAIEHYSNVVELLTGSAKRLYFIAEECEWADSDARAKAIMHQTQKIIFTDVDELD